MTARNQRPPIVVRPRRTNRVWTALLVTIVLILAPVAVALVTLVATVVLPVLLRLGRVFWSL